MIYVHVLVLTVHVEVYAGTASHTVSVALHNKEVVFNEDVQLECIGSGPHIGNLTSYWWKDDKIILGNGITNHANEENEHHYSEFLEYHNKTFISRMFIIHNFTKSDQSTYRCVIGVEEDEVSLHLNEDRFIYMPDDYTVSFLNTADQANSFDMVLNMPKVYPKPKCWISIKDRVINFVTPNIKLVEWFYSAEFKKQLLITPDECGAMVITECQIGSRSVQLNKTRLVNCQKEDSWMFDPTSLCIGAGSISLLFVIVVLICCLKRRNKIKIRQKKSKLLINNTKIENNDIELSITGNTVDENKAEYSGSLNSTVNVKCEETLLQNVIDDQFADNEHESMINSITKKS